MGDNTLTHIETSNWYYFLKYYNVIYFEFQQTEYFNIETNVYLLGWQNCRYFSVGFLGPGRQCAPTYIVKGNRYIRTLVKTAGPGLQVYNPSPNCEPRAREERKEEKKIVSLLLLLYDHQKGNSTTLRRIKDSCK